MSIESIIRPAQLPSNQPPKQIRQRRTSANWTPIVCRIESPGNPKLGAGSVSQSVTYYHKRKPTEQQGGSSMGFGGGIGITFP